MRFISVFVCLIYATGAFGQLCNKPNPSFCPGNFFQNGDFETITGNPNGITSDDINLATGWQAMWATGSLADLHCTGGSNSTGTAPTPNSAVYAGMWIRNQNVTNTSSHTHREGMYNRLSTLIPENTGSYSFNFKIAWATGFSSTAIPLPVSIGIYGVLNPSNVIANNPVGHNANPTNINLWLNKDVTVKVVLLGTVMTPANFTNTWVPQTVTFNSSILPVGGITHIMITADDLPRPQQDRNVYINFDEFCLQKATLVPVMSTCCPHLKNLVKNPDFTSGNSNFTSDYQYNATAAAGALLPGQYNVTNTDVSNKLCDQWNIKDHTNCTTSGLFMVVNGQTGLTGQKKIWEQTVSVAKDKSLTFCAYFKNLPACCFDVKPKIDVKFSGNTNSDVIGEIIDMDPTSACAWKEVKKYLSSGNNTSITITILLNETDRGDGNDLAIDDIALVELPPVPIQYVQFGIPPNKIINNGGLTYSMTAEAINPLPASYGDCGVFWEVCELDNANQCINLTKISNPSQWWGLANYNMSINFAGYEGDDSLGALTSPGKFDYKKRYRITRGVFCTCLGWTTWSVDVNTTGNNLVVRDSNTKTVLSEIKMKKN